MKKKLTIILLTVACALGCAFAFAACVDKVPEYTVTFVSDGQTYTFEKVKSGEKVNEPTAPTKTGYVLTGWYDGETEYDFDTPVTEDKTLTAGWEVAKYTVTFDSNNGSAAKTETVEHGDTVEKPETPVREGYCFEGWYKGETKYDFSAAVTEATALKAKWTSEADINAAFTAALSADYSNFTSASTVSEQSDSYTDTFFQTANLAYWKTGSALFEDHLVVFSDDGRMLALYYLHEEAWVRSNLMSYADFVVALDLDLISTEDVYYSEGVYHVYQESISSVVYALFRSTESYTDFYIIIENGRIALVGGTISGGITHVQNFYNFGTTQIEMPEIPAVSVEFQTKNKDAQAGTAINAAELISFMFVVTVEGKNYQITSDMVDFGGLNLEVPAVGEYTVTVSFDTWDGETHSQTATVTVKVDDGGGSFADIFNKDYTNVTLTYGTTTFKRVGEVYTSSAVANAYYFAEADNSLTKYVVSGENCTATANNWFVLPRLEMLFALDSSIFVKEGDTDVYTAKNVEAIVPVLLKTALTKTAIIDQTQDYSISLTVSLGRVTKISFNYFSKLSTSAKASARSLEYTLSDFGDTEITVPDVVLAQRTASTAEQAAYIDDRKYAA